MEQLPKFTKTKSRKNKDMLLVDDTYLYNLIKVNKDKSKLYKCYQYKTVSKCQAFIKLNEKEEIIKFKGNHNHLENEIYTTKEESRKKLKNEIINSIEPFLIKINKLYKTYSADKGIKAPSFNSIKTTLYREITKILPNDIEDFESIPDESLYYKTIDNNNFLLYKNNRIVVFQSNNMAKIHAKFGDIVFADATYYSCPNLAYQLFITRVFDETYNSYYTTSFTLMNGKTGEDYFLVFKKLHEHISSFLDINENYMLKELHTDFEITVGSAAKRIYPQINIKYCIWHQRRAIEAKKNSICKSDIRENDNLYILFNAVCNLFLCDPKYIGKVFQIIKQKSSANPRFTEFLNYFDNEYIKIYKIPTWNYYNNYRHVTNNSCEAYNSKMNKLFDKNPNYFKSIYELQIEEATIVNNYNKRQAGLLGHEIRKNTKVLNLINIIEKYEEEINDMPSVTSFDKNLIAFKWFECLSKIRFSNL